MMKAKNILLYSAMAGMALSLSSCGDDFLSVEPASSLPIDGYYNTKAHVDEALTAAYAPMAGMINIMAYVLSSWYLMRRAMISMWVVAILATRQQFTWLRSIRVPVC